MLKLKFLFISPVFFLALSLYAQNSFKEVESKSYQLYTEEKWQELSDFGTEAYKNGYDYYFLNVRTGRAFFELKNFEASKNYFEKALENNSASTFAREYLFWCYFNMNQQSEACKIYKTLPDSIKKRMDYQPSKALDFIYVEGGIKLSGNNDASDNLVYGGIALNHQFSPRFSLYHDYNYMQQQAIWGEMKQHQYLLMPALKLNNSWSVSSAFNYSNYKSSLNYVDSAKWVGGHSEYSSGGSDYIVDTNVVEKYVFKGNYEQNAILTQLNFSKKIAGWAFSPHIGLYKAWETPDYYKNTNTVYDIREIKVFSPPPTLYSTSKQVNDTFNTDNNYQQWQYGLDINYSFKNKLMIGLDANYIYYPDYARLNLSPYARIKIAEHFSIFAYYVKKENYVLSLFGGSQFMNSYDAVKNKVSVSLEFKLSPKFGLFTTFQHENIGDNLSLREYQFSSLFIGLKFRP